MRRSVLGILGVLLAGSLAAQATNPPYLSQFPTVARVKQAMQASDPRETALKQMGAFEQLMDVIKQLSGRREFRGLLPDEARLVQSYYEAQYYIGRAIDSAFPGPYLRWQKVSDNTPYHYMRTDPRFGVEGIETFKLLISPAIQELFYQSTGAEKARFAARARADSESILQARRDQAAAQQQLAGAGPSPVGPSPAQRQLARCVESGRSQAQCLMEGIGNELSGFVGAVVPELKKAPIQGIRMSGVYPGEGKFGLTFYNESVGLSCADLELASHEYTAAATSVGLRITIVNEPNPIVLAVRPDGSLVGVGPTDITGQVIVGYQEGVRTWSDGRTEPISRPIYETRTRRCNVATLRPSGPAPVLGSLSTAPAALLNLAFGSPDPDAGKPAPVGVRMSGEYGSQAGLDIEFKPEGAVVGCREATILRPYTVQVQGTQVVVKLLHGATPFDLTFGADGSLSGAGSVRVDGRAVTAGGPSDQLNYVPRSATCSLSLLPPAVAQLSEVEQGAAAARASLGQPAPAGTSAPAGAVFQLEGAFPGARGAASPLAGKPFLLLDAPLDNILKEIGLAHPAGLSAVATTSKAYGSAMETPDCQKLVKAILAHSVMTLRPDSSGTAQSAELPAGRTYFLWGAATLAGKKYTWHLPLTAKAGWTKVVLMPANAAP